jgi:hypothetical protein
VFFLCFENRVVHRQPENLASPFPGGNAGNDVGLVFNHLLGVEPAFPAGDSLHDQSGVFIYEKTHRAAPFARASTPS